MPRRARDGRLPTRECRVRELTGWRTFRHGRIDDVRNARRLRQAVEELSNAEQHTAGAQDVLLHCAWYTHEIEEHAEHESRNRTAGSGEEQPHERSLVRAWIDDHGAEEPRRKTDPAEREHPPHDWNTLLS